jgi:hypothetical protein
MGSKAIEFRFYMRRFQAFLFGLNAVYYLRKVIANFAEIRFRSAIVPG